MVVNYENGKIYKIVSPHTDEVYIGSTAINLRQRWAIHNYHCRTCYNNCVGDKIISYGDADIQLIENYPCENARQLRQREDYWISNTPNTINRNRAYLSPEERKQKARERMAVIYASEEGRARARQYYRDNREVKLQKGKLYYQKKKALEQFKLQMAQLEKV